LSDLLQGVSLYLVGMMGCGKTTVGRILAQQLQYQFFDTDALIEQVAGCSVRTLFAESGEAAFRQLESQVLSQLSAYTHLAIATGGGIVIKRENWSYLQHGIVVWLDVPIEQLYARLSQDTTRPLLQAADPLAKLTHLWQERHELYAQADVRVVVDPQSDSQQVATQTLAAIAQVIKAPQPIPEWN
jgi:shikimate kinase